MSTKWIEEVLRCVEREFGAPGSAHVAVARAEVEAIKRTVKDFAEKPLDPERRTALFNLAHAIAKETGT